MEKGKHCNYKAQNQIGFSIKFGWLSELIIDKAKGGRQAKCTFQSE